MKVFEFYSKLESEETWYGPLIPHWFIKAIAESILSELGSLFDSFWVILFIFSVYRLAWSRLGLIELHQDLSRE